MGIQSMRAAWYEKQGGARDVIQYGEMSVPEPSPGEVRVRVHASGVNPSDTKVRGGWGGITVQFPRIIPHQDGAASLKALVKVSQPHVLVNGFGCMKLNKDAHSGQPPSMLWCRVTKLCTSQITPALQKEPVWVSQQ
jgi:hypothetical protein